MKDPIVLKVELPKIPDIELVALEGLDRLARHMGIAEEKIGEARIAVTEAIINAFEHGSAGTGGDFRVEIEFTVTPSELVVFVRDHGRGFATAEAGTQGKAVESKRTRGWGLKLMKSMSDDLRIQTGPSGTTITIKKLLK